MYPEEVVERAQLPPTVYPKEVVERAHQLLRNPWKLPSIWFIGMLGMWEIAKRIAIVAARIVGLWPVTVFGVLLLMPLTMLLSIWEHVALLYVGNSFKTALVKDREKSRRWGRILLDLGIKALICFLQKWGNVVVQQLALFLITYYTVSTGAFSAYTGLLVFGFLLQWLGETELDITKAWCLCFATVFRLYHVVYLSNLWGMGFRGCHPITRVAFMTTTYYIKAADDDLLSSVCDGFEMLTPKIEDTSMSSKAECPVPYPLTIIFNSSSTVHLKWTQGTYELGMVDGQGILEVDHKFETKLFGWPIPSIETDYRFRQHCSKFGCARVFKFMNGVETANEVLMKHEDFISRCYNLRDTIAFVADPTSKLVIKYLEEEHWCC